MESADQDVVHTMHQSVAHRTANNITVNTAGITNHADEHLKGMLLPYV